VIPRKGNTHPFHPIITNNQPLLLLLGPQFIVAPHSAHEFTRLVKTIKQVELKKEKVMNFVDRGNLSRHDLSGATEQLLTPPTSVAQNTRLFFTHAHPTLTRGLVSSQELGHDAARFYAPDRTPNRTLRPSRPRQR
jgi:hypothetical protein